MVTIMLFSLPEMAPYPSFLHTFKKKLKTSIIELRIARLSVKVLEYYIFSGKQAI